MIYLYVKSSITELQKALKPLCDVVGFLYICVCICFGWSLVDKVKLSQFSVL